jgi:hypothetical protein
MVCKKQAVSLCYRFQFGLDLAKRMIAYCSQGAMIRNSLVPVDLEISNPSAKLSSDSTPLLYVAIARPTELKYLLISPIFPAVWQLVGRES